MLKKCSATIECPYRNEEDFCTKLDRWMLHPVASLFLMT